MVGARTEKSSSEFSGPNALRGPHGVKNGETPNSAPDGVEVVVTLSLSVPSTAVEDTSH